MSWLFSQALVAAYSEATFSDGEPSALSNGNPTQLAYLPPDRMTAFSRPSRSGMTFRPLTEDLGAAVLTSYLAAFPARTSASRGGVQESTANAAGCGGTWRGSLARFDPATSSWRTVQPSLLEDLGESSVIWPRSGMTAGGQCWELPMLGRRTSAIGFGLWPTSTVCGNYNRKGASASSGDGLATAVAKWPTPTASAMPCEGTQRIMRNKWLAGELTLEEASAMAGRDVRKAQGKVAAWPTPTSQGRDAGGTDPRRSLYTAVRFSTPLARDHKSGKFSQDGKAHRESQTRGKPLSEQIGGSLNPTWVEWLMGWPLGWTDLRPLATDRCLSAPQPPGSC